MRIRRDDGFRVVVVVVSAAMAPALAVAVDVAMIQNFDT